MKKHLQRFAAVALALCMIIGILPVSALANDDSMPFTDVPSSAWYYDAVAYVYDNGLMAGTSGTTFSPDSTLTRAMLVTVLYRLAGAPEMYTAADFSDVPASGWYAESVAWAQENGIAAGYADGSFAPDAPVTREQLVAMQYRYALLMGRNTDVHTELDAFRDAAATSRWALDAMQWAVAAKIVCGKENNTLDPTGLSTRAEAAGVIMRFVEATQNDADADMDGVPAWLEELLGCSDTNTDSDGDGIDDYTEIYVIGSEPNVADSDIDTDDDGLSNLDEINLYGTKPNKSDSDLDGLNDAEELSLGTNPLSDDSDGDGICDGDEVKLGTDPMAPTDLTTHNQQLDEEKIDEDLLTDNAAVPSVSGVSADVLDNTVALDTATEEALRNLPAVVGKGVKLTLNANAALELSFTTEADAAAFAVMELSENGWQLVQTTATSNQLQAQVDHSGTYAVVDLSVLLPYLGIDTDACYQAVLSGDTQREIAVNEKSGSILLDDYQYIPAVKGGYHEEQEVVEQDFTPLVKYWLHAQGISETDVDAYFDIAGAIRGSTIRTPSNPTLDDTDFDGISDKKDAAPKNGTFTGKLTTGSATSSVSYTWDYRTFFASPDKYNKNLCTASLIFSSMIYSGASFAYSSSVAYDGGTASTVKNISKLLQVHGMSDVVDYKLTASKYKDDDLSEVALGHHAVTYNGDTKEVVAVVIRGTNGTIEEWSSNFDMGNRSQFNSFADWKDSKNHKGFDVAANRIMDYLKSYASKNGLNSGNVVFWVTGHSRGAAIANLVSAKLIDQGKTVFGYTFAAPNTTVSTSAENAKYRAIFNLVNEDDFVPCVPMTAWKFRRFGVSATIDMTSSMENEWHDLVGKSWYNQMSAKNLSELVGKLAGVAKGWDACYVYTCKCHGDASSNNITQSGLTASDLAKIPKRAKKYCKIEQYKSLWLTRYKSCQIPAYFMQILAEITSANGLGNQISAVTGYKLADRYEGARNKLVTAASVGGIAHPHYCETYYLLSQHVKASDFKK